MKVKDKVIIVTGGGSGMGRALALQLIAMQAKVIGIDVNDAALQETASLAGINKREALEPFAENIPDREGKMKSILS